MYNEVNKKTKKNKGSGKGEVRIDGEGSTTCRNADNRFRTVLGEQMHDYWLTDKIYVGFPAVGQSATKYELSGLGLNPLVSRNMSHNLVINHVIHVAIVAIATKLGAYRKPRGCAEQSNGSYKHITKLVPNIAVASCCPKPRSDKASREARPAYVSLGVTYLFSGPPQRCAEL